MTNLYLQLISRAVLAFGGLVYAYRLVTGTDPFANNLSIPVMILFGLIAIAGILNAFDRNFYLPFLGQTVMPLPNGDSNGAGTGNSNGDGMTTIVIKDLPPNVVVVAWAAQESDTAFADPFIAYGDYSNTTKSKSDAEGVAIVRLKCPSTYSVKRKGMFMKSLPRHIHYRYELPEYKGMFSEVMTRDLDEECQ